ncbi:fumarylacetoacetate hydrolase family protein [Lysinibacillus sphaericus]
MRIIRFNAEGSEHPLLGAVTRDDKVYSLPHGDFLELVVQAKSRNKKPSEIVTEYIGDNLPINERFEDLDLLLPIEAPEVWASGVTYQKSREARNYEATAGKLDATTFYDKVYDAHRPELFMKSTRQRTIGPNKELYLRSDSNWQIPEPELGLVLDEEGEILGYTVGNDMSCRDIEGENPLYLPQAKIWSRSCSIGPTILLADSVEDPYAFNIICSIYRSEELVFKGEASTGQLKRKYDELVSFLKRDNDLFSGSVLLTGTCIVPPNEFTLADGDVVEIEISGIGSLVNPVKSQVAQPAS